MTDAWTLIDRPHESDLMREYARGHDCLESLLRRALDDPVEPGERCGRCSVCTGSLPGGLEARPSREASDAARAFVRGLDVVLEPRAMFAPRMAAVPGRESWKGKIPATLLGMPGRALAFAEDIGWERMGEVTGPESPDSLAPDWLLEGWTALLERWIPSLPNTPDVVVPVPSSRLPDLVRSLSAAASQHLGAPIVECLEQVGARPAPDLSPQARASVVAARLRVRDAVDVPHGFVLLVDDTWRSGWTATIATVLLREAGARTVVPVVAHRLP